MSKTQSHTHSEGEQTTEILLEDEEQLREAILDTFASHESSRQAVANPSPDRHIDGENARKAFGMRSLADVLDEQLERNHPMATEPRAFIDAFIHLDDWDKRLIESDDISLEDEAERYPKPRRKILQWLGEHTDLARLNKGGTDAFIHGLPGSTKTTCLQYIAVRAMENFEDVVWAATPGRSEWATLAPWTTVCWPSDLEKRLQVNPVNPNVEPFHMPMSDLVRDVVEYDNPEDLMETLRDRPKGEFYVVYPDPKFRLCEYYTRHSYTNIWEADDLEEETPLVHWWFAFAKARVEGVHNDWMTFILDEADELLDDDASKDQHDTYQKVKMFRNSFRDFRKTKLSLYLAAHARDEVNLMVRKKLRWTLTMNQEELPEDAPADGDWTEDMDLGEGMIWKVQKYASFSWPPMGSYFPSPAKFVVEYPGHDEAQRGLARPQGGGDGS